MEISTLGYILIFTFIGSVISLVGGVILLFKEKFAIKISHYLASFAAGALLGTAFFDLLPEASEESGEINIFLWALLGILLFFLLERFIYWFHHHHEHGEPKTKPIIPLIMLGDSVHNFIDGVVVAATFLVSIPLGIVTAFAVAAHEIPQEIGDFGIMLHQGMKRSRVLLFNFLSALTALTGALITFYAADFIQGLLPVFLSVTAGFFIYIAASDLIPEIHNEEKRKVALMETVLLLVGVATIWVVVGLLEGAS